MSYQAAGVDDVDIESELMQLLESDREDGVFHHWATDLLARFIDWRLVPGTSKREKARLGGKAQGEENLYPQRWKTGQLKRQDSSASNPVALPLCIMPAASNIGWLASQRS